MEEKEEEEVVEVKKKAIVAPSATAGAEADLEDEEVGAI